jgi:hypothetical protein
MASGAVWKNMRLLGHNDLGGFGNCGEGLSLQKTRDGRRVLYIAHESAPKNFTAVDVTDPRTPKVIAQTDLPHKQVRSNSLDVVGDVMAVAYQTQQPGMTPAGIELLDVSVPEKPQSIATLDRSGEYSRGTHCLWFVDGEYIHMTSGAPDFQPRRQKDDQFYQIVDVRNPSQPQEVGRWWFPGTREGDAEPLPELPEPIDKGFRSHNTNVYPERPDRAYVGYLGAGVLILDISDKSKPKLTGRVDCNPPMWGFTHTVLPLFTKDVLIATDEALDAREKEWPKLTWVIDARDETKPVLVGSLPLPAGEELFSRPGRSGSHNLHENHPVETAFRSDTLVFGSYFSGGVRVHDVSNPYSPAEVAYYIPEPPPNSRAGSAQINDVYVDENRIVYAVDRFAGGLYTLELTL